MQNMAHLVQVTAQRCAPRPLLALVVGQLSKQATKGTLELKRSQIQAAQCVQQPGELPASSPS